jgi:hypothetical protein
LLRLLICGFSVRFRGGSPHFLLFFLRILGPFRVAQRSSAPRERELIPRRREQLFRCRAEFESRVALSTDSGETRWSVPVANPYGWLACNDSAVFYLNQHSRSAGS